MWQENRFYFKYVVIANSILLLLQNLLPRALVGFLLVFLIVYFCYVVTKILTNLPPIILKVVDYEDTSLSDSIPTRLTTKRVRVVEGYNEKGINLTGQILRCRHLIEDGNFPIDGQVFQVVLKNGEFERIGDYRGEYWHCHIYHPEYNNKPKRKSTQPIEPMVSLNDLFYPDCDHESNKINASYADKINNENARHNQEIQDIKRDHYDALMNLKKLMAENNEDNE